MVQAAACRHAIGAEQGICMSEASSTIWASSSVGRGALNNSKSTCEQVATGKSSALRLKCQEAVVYDHLAAVIGRRV